VIGNFGAQLGAEPLKRATMIEFGNLSYFSSTQFYFLLLGDQIHLQARSKHSDNCLDRCDHSDTSTLVRLVRATGCKKQKFRGEKQTECGGQDCAIGFDHLHLVFL